MSLKQTLLEGYKQSINKNDILGEGVSKQDE